jgi:hypothetical protein
MDQTVMTFGGTAARGSAIPTPTEGMVTYLADSDTFEFWDGTAYQPFGAGEDLLLVEYLVIAGGGGGGTGSSSFAGGGGGGAGGYRCSVEGESSGQNSSAESVFPLLLNFELPVTIGAGGVGRAANTNAQGGKGETSTFALVISEGGGGGGGGLSAGANGGSGGGAAWSRNDEGLGTANQGFDGGDNSTDFYGGGGGAGEAGDTDGLGQGGDGISSSVTGSGVFRAGGGGGGNNSNAPVGGDGGGGTGARNGVSNGTNGTVNTGGGGGGGYGLNHPSGAGASGIVILKYPTTYTITIGAGLTGTTETVGSNKVTTITAGTGNVSWA